MKTKGVLLVLVMVAISIWLISIGKTLSVKHNSISTGSLHATVTILTIAAAIQVAGHYVRARKSYMMIGLIRKTKIRTLFKAEAVGSLFNVLLPFRIGEFIRAHLIGQSLSISRAAVFLIIIAERIVDGYILSIFMLLSSFFFSTYLGPAVFPLRWLATALLIGSISFTAVLWIIYRSDTWSLKVVYIFTNLFRNNIRDRLRFIAWSSNYGLNIVVKHTPWISYISASLLMWVLFFTSSASVALLPAIKNMSIERLLISSSLPYLISGTPTGPTYLTEYVNTYQGIIGLSADESYLLASGYINWYLLVLPISFFGILLIIISRQPSKPIRSNAEVMRNKLTRDADISNEFSSFLDTFFTGTHLSRALVDSEVKNKYQLIKTFKGGSNASTVLVWENEKLHVKKITLPQYADKLIAQRNWLQEREHLPSLPKVTGYEKAESYFSFNIEFKESYMPFFDYVHAQPIERSERILRKVLQFVYEHIYVDRHKVVDRKARLEKYIEEKAVGKVLDTVAMSAVIGELAKYETLNINGKEYTNFFSIIEKINNNAKAIYDLSQFSDGPIHGDLTIDNIIVSPDEDFIILDPNNENLISDPAVDLGKLYQSLHSGYEFLCGIKDVDIQQNSLAFEEVFSNKYGLLFNYFKSELKNHTDDSTYRSILFHEAIHYCRMLTYRVKINPVTAPVFFAVAVRLFNEFLEQYED